MRRGIVSFEEDVSDKDCAERVYSGKEFNGLSEEEYNGIAFSCEEYDGRESFVKEGAGLE